MLVYYVLQVCTYIYSIIYRLYLVVFSVEDSFGASSVTRLEEKW